MATHIEWVQGEDGEQGDVWNIVAGCAPVSPGCANCYAVPLSHKLAANPATPQYKGLTVLREHGGPRFTGVFRELPERLPKPLHKRKPTTYFANSMSDLFGEGVRDEFIAAGFGVMAATPRHTYQVLTKRAERLPEWAKWVIRNGSATAEIIEQAVVAMRPFDEHARHLFALYDGSWPLPNVWLGVSVEDKKHGLPRIEHLRRTPAAIRFLSIEPLLEDLGEIDLTGIQWVIVGGESGRNARPMHPDWVRSIRDQCVKAGVKFFFKQWGSWAPAERVRKFGSNEIVDELRLVSGPQKLKQWDWFEWPGLNQASARVGKKAAGRMLDGRTWDEMPERVI